MSHDDVLLVERNAEKLGIVSESGKRRLHKMILVWRRIAAEIQHAPQEDERGREEIISAQRWSGRPDLSLVIKRYLRVSVWETKEQAKSLANYVREAYRSNYAKTSASAALPVGDDYLMTEEERQHYLKGRKFGKDKLISEKVAAEIKADPAINTRKQMRKVYERVYRQETRMRDRKNPFDLLVYISSNDLSSVPSVREAISRALIDADPSSPREAAALAAGVRRRELGREIPLQDRANYIGTADFTPDSMRNQEVREMLMSRVDDLNTMAKINSAASLFLDPSKRGAKSKVESCTISVHADELTKLTQAAAQKGVTVNELVSALVPKYGDWPIVDQFPFSIVEDIRYVDTIRHIEVKLTKHQRMLLKQGRVELSKVVGREVGNKEVVEAKLISAANRMN